MATAYRFTSRFADDLYWLGVDTEEVTAGSYLIWIVYGEGQTILVPITVLP